jgi:hypothetical protein
MRRGLSATLLAAFAALPAAAHHSFAIYDQSKTITIRGSVKTFQWSNPHCVIWVLAQPPGGGEPEEWSVETTSPGVLTRFGWTRNSVKPGDRVSVELAPLRDGAHGGRLDTLTLLDTGQKLAAASIRDSGKPDEK